MPYLYDWYETRSKVYNLLLYNPQDFSAKCMLADVMDAVLEKEPSLIKWQFTDTQLVDALRGIKEEYWEEIFVPIIKVKQYESDLIFEKLSDENVVRETLEMLEVSVPANANISVTVLDKRIDISFYNTEYYYENGCLYKKARNCMNPSRIINRLMRGDLFACVGIYVSPQVELYDLFSNYKKRRAIEIECNQYLENVLEEREYSIAFHAIVDKNKTNRQLEINIETGECVTIGRNTHEILLGVFLRNAKYGLAKVGDLSKPRRKKISNAILGFLQSMEIECCEHKLYSEVEYSGKRDY